MNSVITAVTGGSGPAGQCQVGDTPTLTLTPDTLALGLYTIEARLGTDTKTQDIDTKAVVPPVALTLP